MVLGSVIPIREVGAEASGKTEWVDRGSTAKEGELDVLLIYTRLGSFDIAIRDIPLSLVHCASESVKRGYKVEILDMRLSPATWKEDLLARLKRGVKLAGLSVMTGNGIREALAVSQVIKTSFPDIPIVWGGPHPTICPEQTLAHPLIDYIVMDGGSVPLWQLIAHITHRDFPLENIDGLGFKRDGKIVLNQRQTSFEFLDFEDIPFHLVDINGKNYNRLDNGEVSFPFFTSVGCPYQCTFCNAPVVYSKVHGKKWLALDEMKILDNIETAYQRYKFSRIQIMDDDTFVKHERMLRMLQGFIDRGLNKHIKIDFRGVRINEFLKMDDDYMSTMEEAGVEMMAIGVESGSDRILKGMKKNITRAQIIEANRRLAKHPKLRPHYNFFCGSPGETYDDLMMTKDLLVQLVDENPRCYIGVGSDWKPLPGSEMTTYAVEHYGLKLPETLEEWANVDSYDAERPYFPWYTPELDRMIPVLQIAGQVLDCKLTDFRDNIATPAGRLLYFATKLYRPLLRLRLRYEFSRFLLEYHIRNWSTKNMGYFIGKKTSPRFVT